MGTHIGDILQIGAFRGEERSCLQVEEHIHGVLYRLPMAGVGEMLDWEPFRQ